MNQLRHAGSHVASALLRRIAIVSLAATVTGCATVKGWFNDVKKENIEPPTPLSEQFSPSASVQRVWSGEVRRAHASCVR